MDGTVPRLDVLARLKQRYHFTLLVDEAHSLLCLGETGRGALEVWNQQHPSEPVPTDLFDLRTGTLSKSVGAIGGFVCGRGHFASMIRRRRDELLSLGADPLPTSSLVQTLNVLGQPALLQRHLRRLLAISIFVREELHRAGVYVYGNAISPILPVYAGRPSMAAKLSYSLRKAGLLATMISIPAVPFWESRVRVCLSADHDDHTVNALIAAIVKASRKIGLINGQKFRSRLFQSPTESLTPQERLEAHEVASKVRGLIQQDMARLNSPTVDEKIISAGHEARHRYGLGSGGSRWITGNSELHIRFERMVAKLTGAQEAMSYPDSFIGLMSTIAALSRPVMGFKQHVFLVPEEAPQAVWDGFRVAPRKGCPDVHHYSDNDSLFEQLCKAGRNTYVTLFVDSLISENPIDLQNTLDTIGSMRGHLGMTTLVHDSGGVGCLSTQYRPSQDPAFDTRNHQLLVFGSLYRAFRLPGAYLAGGPALLKELRYTSRGYMFSTSGLPFIAGMALAEVQKRVELGKNVS
jgi:serine palmitoyltransferase